MQSIITTTYLISVPENMSEIVSLEITLTKTPPRNILEIGHKGQFNKVNKVLSFDMSTNITLGFVFGHASPYKA